jgi:hypothetical protein
MNYAWNEMKLLKSKQEKLQVSYNEKQAKAKQAIIANEKIICDIKA